MRPEHVSRHRGTGEGRADGGGTPGADGRGAANGRLASRVPNVRPPGQPESVGRLDPWPVDIGLMRPGPAGSGGRPIPSPGHAIPPPRRNGRARLLAGVLPRMPESSEWSGPPAEWRAPQPDECAGMGRCLPSPDYDARRAPDEYKPAVRLHWRALPDPGQGVGGSAKPPGHVQAFAVGPGPDHGRPVDADPVDAGHVMRHIQSRVRATTRTTVICRAQRGTRETEPPGDRAGVHPGESTVLIARAAIQTTRSGPCGAHECVLISAHPSKNESRSDDEGSRTTAVSQPRSRRARRST